MSFKRTLSVLIIFVMVFSVMIPAFAQAPQDVIGTEYEDVVAKLVALGIIEGYEDGTFKADRNITRAEFAKIACYVLGLQSAAELAQGTTTKFSDVKASHWASGYISVASQAGIVIGYPDKTFKPSANITYAEAITMLVRALGLGPVVEGKGTWPTNYIAKASQAGVTTNVANLAANGKALRGIVCELAWNTLVAEMWGESKYTSTGVEYGPLGKTLLQDNYKDFVYKDASGNYQPKVFENAVITGTQLVGGLGVDEIQVKYANIANLLNVSSTIDTPRKVSSDEIVVKVVGIDTTGLLGKKVDLFFGKDNKLVSYVVKSGTVVEGYVTDILAANGKIKIDGKEYVLVDGDAQGSRTDIYVNSYLQNPYNTTASEYKLIDGTTANKIANGGINKDLADLKTRLGNTKAKANVVLNDDGKIITLNLFVADSYDQDAVDPSAGIAGNVWTKQFVVKEIRSNGDVYAVDSDSRMFNLDTITGVTSTEKATFEKNGKPATRSDINVGDAITWVKVNANLNQVVITDNKISGTVTSLGTDSGTARYLVTVNGTTYSMPNDVSVTSKTSVMTKTGNVADKIVVDSSYVDFANKAVTLTLNANNQIVLTAGTVTANANFQYGVLTDDVTNYGAQRMEVRTSTGVKVNYTITGDKYKTAAASVPTVAATAFSFTAGVEDNLKKGTFVQYRVNADGTVSAENLVNLGTVEVTNAAGFESKTQTAYEATYGNVTVSHSAKTVAFGGKTYYYTPNTVVYNKTTGEMLNGWDTLSNSGGDNFADSTRQSGAYIVYDTDYSTIKYLVVGFTSANALTSSAKSGIVTRMMYNDDGSSDWKIDIYSEGQVYTYKVAGDVYRNGGTKKETEVGDFVVYTLTGDGKFDGATSASFGGATLANAEAKQLVDKSEVLLNTNGAFDHYEVANVSGQLVSFKANTNSGTIHAATTIQVKSDVKIYDISGSTPKMVSMSDIQAGDVVFAADKDASDNMYKVLVKIR